MNTSAKLTSIIASSILLASAVVPALARDSGDGPGPNEENFIALDYSDGTAPALGLEAVNESLRSVGVRVSQVAIPDEARSILRVSKSRALSATEADDLIQLFPLGRRELVEQITLAGREPAMPRGGYLQTSEVDVPPYPKVYDMKSLDEDLIVFLQRKFGRLHVNTSESGVGIDEVMTIVSGGPYTWFFVLEGNVVGKLRFGVVEADGKAWRISYPGLVPHGGFFDAPDGLVVAYAHGPRHFVMRYDDPSVDGFETLGGNPWIDFSSERPVLLTRPQTQAHLGSNIR